MAGQNVGEYTISVTAEATANPNYTITTETDTFSITPAAITISADEKTKVYDNDTATDPELTATVSNDKPVNGVEPVYSVSRVAGQNVGEYTISVTAEATANPNYTITTETDTFSITAREIQVAVEDKTVEYNGSEQYGNTAYKFTNVLEGQTATIGYTAAKGTLVGTYDNGTYADDLAIVDGEGNNITTNYNLTVKTAGKLTITDRTEKYAITVVANSNTGNVYDGKQKEAKGFKALTFTVDGNTYTVEGLTTSDPSSTDVATLTNAISGTAVVKDANGNDVTAQFTVSTENGTLEIGKKKITLTVDAKTKTYGDKDPEFTASFGKDDLVEGDTIDYTLTRKEGEDVGTYEITTTINDKNYEVTVVPANLGINQKAVTIKADSDSKQYDASALTKNSYTNSALAAGDEIATVTITGSQTVFGSSDNIASAAKIVKADGEDATGNYAITYEKGTLSVTKKPVTITADGDKKVYDGTALAKNSFTNTALATGDSVTATVTGSQTVKGKSDNVPSAAVITNAANEDVTASYDITYANGALEVTAKPVTITADSDNRVYDGTALTKNSFTNTALATGDSVTATITGSQIVKGKSDNVPSAAVIKNEANEDVTASYDITYANGTLEVTPKAVTITADTGTKVYDATELTKNSFTNTALATGDSVTATITGSQTVVGESDNVPSNAVFTNAAGEDVTESYHPTYINGKLAVTQNISVIITADSDTKEYDGTALTKNSYQVTGLATGDHVDSVKITGTQTVAGKSNNVPSEARILNAADEDVTASYAVNYNNGTLEVTQKALTITAESDTKVYDGTALAKNSFTNTALAAGDSVTATITGSQTVAGKSDNVPSAAVITNAAGEDVTASYNITYVNGKLEVTAKPVTITADGDKKVYDGTALAKNSFTNTALATGDTVNATVTGSQTVKGKSDNVPSAAVITNAAGEDVTDSYAITYANGTLEVTAKPVTITADSETKVYDATALAKNSFTNTALATGDTVNATVTGSQTVKGKSSNVPSAAVITNAANEDVTDSYDISYVNGTLEVTAKPITITADSDTKVYDATALVKNTYKNSALAGGDRIDSIVLTGSQTVKGTTNNVPSAAVIKTEDGADVTGSYDITYVNGTLEVTAKPVTITADGSKKVYDGTALAKNGFSNTALATGDSVTATVTGSQTVKGTSDNVPSAAIIKNAAGEDVTASYDITYANGTLEVTAKPVTITADSDKKMYDGTALAKNSFTNTALATGDSVTATVTGSQTVKGSSANVPSAAVITNAANEDVTASYDISYTNGTLEVTAKPVTITADSDTKVYDATELTKNSYTNTALAAGDSVTATITGSQTVVGESDNVPSNAAFTNEAGEDVTASYQVSYISGLLKVTQNSELIITADSETKVYDGTALTKNSYQVAGLAEGDHVDAVTITGTQTVAGKSNNVPSEARILNASNEDVTASYAINYRNGTLEVTQKALTITADSDTKVYDATALTNNGFTNTALAAGDTVNATVTGSQTVKGKSDNVPSAAVITNATNEDVTASYDITYVNGTLEVTPKAVTVTADSETKVYDATALTKDSFTNTDLAADDSITATITGSQTVAGKSINSASAAKIRNTADEDVTASYDITYVDGTLEVTQKAITITADSDTKVYDGTGLMNDGFTNTALAEGDSIESVQVTGWQLDAGSSENIAEAAKIVNAAGEDVTASYAVAYVNGTLEVTRKPVTITADAIRKIYGDEDPDLTAIVEGAVAIRTRGGERTEAIDFSLARANGENVSEYTISVTPGLNPNYDVTVVDGLFTIVKKPITLTVDAKAKTYGDEDPAFTASFAEGDLVGNDTIDYTLSRVAGENVGSYQISTEIEHDNYDVTVVPADLTITRKAITLTVDAKTKTYGDEDPALTASFGADDLVGEDTIDYTLTRAEGENTGAYTISTIIDDPNYDVTVVPAELTIDRKAITLTVDAKAKTYGDEDPEFTASFEEGDLVGEDTIDYTLARAEGENAGAYEISTVIDNPNYDVTIVPAELTINKKAITLTVDAASKTYGDEDPAFTASFGEGDLVGEDKIDYTLIRENGENAGTYEITTGIANDNYDVTVVPANLTIRPKAATITADSKTKTYGDSDPVLTAVVSGMARNDAAIYTLSREAGQNVGTYAINAAVQANPNYIFTVVPGTLTIGPKAVTVTPDNKVKTFGGEDPALTAVVTGLVNGDSADLISYTLEREGGEDAGEYAIRATGEAAQGNYTVSFAEGAATIVPADTVIVRIAANNGSYQYDGIEKDLSGYTVTEISNDLYTEADFAFNGSSELKGTNAGIYRTAMQASDFENVNDNFSSVIFEVTNGELEITKRAVTMTSGDAAKDYDGTALMNTEITFTGDGFVAGEEPVITVTGRQTREGTSENTFVYALPANASEDNYDVTVVYGTLAVANSTGHHLIIRYVDEDGNELDKPFDRIYADGEAYNVSIPRKTGYNADQTKVAGVMNGADIEVTVKYSIAPYTLTVEFSSILDGTTAAHSLTLSHKSGEAYDLEIPAFDGYTPMVDRITGIMPSGNRTITVFMIPDGEDAEAVRRTYRDYDMMVIDDYGTALGAFNSVLGSGELAE